MSLHFRKIITLFFAVMFTGCSSEEDIFNAICRNDIAFLKVALDLGWDPNKEFEFPGMAYRLLPLMFRFEPGLHCDLTVDTAEFLIESGADVNRSIGGDHVPLHDAAGSNDFEFVKLFVRHGADVNKLDGFGETPVLQTLDVEIAKFLVNAGTDVSVVDREGKTIYDHVSSGRFDQGDLKDKELAELIKRRLEQK